MSNNFKLIQSTPKNRFLLHSMHKLRHKVFYETLGWRTGLKVIDGMEFDEYDRRDVYYVVRIDERGDVDATCRLMPTHKPYMIADHYAHFVQNISVPHSPHIWEISRFCASEEARKTSHGTVSGQLIAAAIEFGIVNEVTNYIALTTDNVLPIIKRVSGWDPRPLGDKKATPQDHAYSVMYTVDVPMLRKIRQKNNINGNLLFDIDTFINSKSRKAA